MCGAKKKSFTVAYRGNAKRRYCATNFGLQIKHSEPPIKVVPLRGERGIKRCHQKPWAVISKKTQQTSSLILRRPSVHTFRRALALSQRIEQSCRVFLHLSNSPRHVSSWAFRSSNSPSEESCSADTRKKKEIMI